MLKIIILSEIILIRSLFLLSLVVFVMGSLLIQPIDARTQPKTNLELYLENEVILIGEIISAEEFSKQGHTRYDIKVEKYLKNPQPSNDITAFGGGTKSGPVSSIDKVFDKGDRVFLLLNSNNGNYQISIYSVWAESFNPDSDFIISPLKLYKAGIPADDIVCKNALILVQKLSDNSPACVKQASIEKLIERGWLGTDYEKLVQ